MGVRNRIVIVGASSAIAEHCARLWVQRDAVDLTLIGRDKSRIERVAADLRARSPQSMITSIQADFCDPGAIRETVDKIADEGAFDIVLIAHGALSDQHICQGDLAVCHEALEINGVSPALYAEAFASHLAQAGKGTLALIGSVAGDRGRKSNYVYGAAKALIACYAQGLQHRFAGTNVKILLIKPGPTDTPMTSHLKAQGVKLASVQEVARYIVEAIDLGKAEIYVPKKWRLIMLIIRNIPRFIFAKLNI
jgi:decaprenylphospho-beta-D-erythro-pentofuranosid-2-ulose 2-reductase